MRALLVALTISQIACQSLDTDTESKSESEATTTGTSSQKLVAGTPSTAARDAVVKLIKDGEIQCSGTLIAPDLVLTARHCVQEVVGNGECASFGTSIAPTALTIVLGANATDSAPTAATGKKTFVDSSSDTCSHDLALLQLDRKVAGAKTFKVRFAPAKVNEATTIVGYGDNEKNTHEHLRMERALKVAAIGPAQAKHNTTSYQLPAAEVATGQGSCPGDSGGPLLDANNQILGVVSRGLGQECGADQATIFSATAGHKALIQQAATAVGLNLEDTEVEPTTTTPGPDPDVGDTDDHDHEEGDDHDHEHDDDDDKDSKSSKKKKSSSTSPLAGQATVAACSAQPGSGSTGSRSGTVGVVLALSLLCARRRRPSSKSSSRRSS